MLNRRNIATSAAEYAGLLAIAAAFALANGIAYGVSNHNQYLLHGLRAIDPQFLAGDWFTCATRPHHSAFVPLMAMLSAIGPLPLMFAVANAAAAGVVVFCLHALARRWFDAPLVVTALAAFILIAIPKPQIGLSSLVGIIFQPSTIGSVGLFAGLALVCIGRYRGAGLAFFCASLFHINYMAWAVLIVGAVVLLNFRRLGMRSAMWLIVPIAPAVLYHLPFVAASRDPAQVAAAGRAAWILHDLYMPYHSRPMTWGVEPFQQFGGMLLIGAVATVLFPPRRVDPIARSVLLVLLSVIALGTIFTTLWPIDAVALLFPYRLVPFVTTLGVLLVAVAMVRAVCDLELSPIRAASLAVVAMALYFVGVDRYSLTTVGTMVALLVAGRIASVHRASLRPLSIAFAVFATLLVVAGVGPLQLGLVAGVVAVAVVVRVMDGRNVVPRISMWISFRARSMTAAVATALAVALLLRTGLQRKDALGPSPAACDARLFDWCRTTAPGTRFIIPPDLIGFRLHSGRAVVIDWKCMPILPADTLHWYERLAAVAGIRFTSFDQCLAAYRTIDGHRARLLGRDYRADFLVTRAGEHIGDLGDLPVEIQTDAWRVYRIVPRTDLADAGDVP